MGWHHGERFASVLCRWKMKATKGQLTLASTGICTARPLDDVSWPNQGSSRVVAQCLLQGALFAASPMIPSIRGSRRSEAPVLAGKPENLQTAIRRTLADIDPNLTVLDMMSLSEHFDRNFNQDRLIARLTELFGLLALVLACVGLYGVTAYSVARRTSEIGIRMALGADRGNVLGLVLRGALSQIGLGLAVGIPVALAAGRLLGSQLYGVKSYDPVILSFAAAALTACALQAGFIPARSAASIEPMQALRAE
jgi:predicted lysophospholipase L1 biosynthesis ABC-type transport system permease subunit